MVQTNNEKDLFEVLEPSFGSVKELCETISDSALNLSLVPLVDSGDYVVIQEAIGIMLELKKAFESAGSIH